MHHVTSTECDVFILLKTYTSNDKHVSAMREVWCRTRNVINIAKARDAKLTDSFIAVYTSNAANNALPTCVRAILLNQPATYDTHIYVKFVP